MTVTGRRAGSPLRQPWALVRTVLCLVLGLMILAAPAGTAEAGTEGDRDPGATVLVTRVDDPITPIVADHLEDAVTAAEDGAHQALIVELDTPGGLSTSMRDIVQDFLAAEVPVVVHVTPRGARAASAGALIGWSAHVVAMSPSTTIGAATPVQLEGGEVGEKVVEDAAAYARAVAEARGRNVDVAAESVTEGRALSDSEAIETGVADLRAGDRAALLESLDGVEVTLPDGTVTTLATAGATVVEYELTWLRSVLQFLADPNLAFLLLSIGTLGIVYELASPGIGAGGGLGAVLIILGLVALSVLPVDAAGLLFLVLAAALFVAEVFAPGVGIAAVLGAVSLVLAAVFTFRDDAPGMSVSLAAVVPTAVVISGAVVVAGRLALRARAEPPVTGPRAFLGHELVVERATGTSAQVRTGGSWWTVRSEHPLAEGTPVRVTDVDGLVLIVEPLPEPEREEEKEP